MDVKKERCKSGLIDAVSLFTSLIDMNAIVIRICYVGSNQPFSDEYQILLWIYVKKSPFEIESFKMVMILFVFFLLRWFSDSDEF